MNRIQTGLAAVLVAVSAMLPAAMLAEPALAAADNSAAAGAFIDDLSDRAYAVLRDKSNDKATVRTTFRTLLKQNFAVDEIGNKLIRRHTRTITKAQYQAYASAFPDYVVDTYTDNLFEFADSDLRVLRSIPRGTRGNIDVYTRIVRNDGAQPIDAIWSVRQEPGGKYLVTNLTVAGVNLSLTQEADFNAFIARNGFDALVKFMRDKKSA